MSERRRARRPAAAFAWMRSSPAARTRCSQRTRCERHRRPSLRYRNARQPRATLRGSADDGLTRRAHMSRFRSPRPLKPSCRAKEQRNHNPRVGGSSPSSGIAVLGQIRAAHPLSTKLGMHFGCGRQMIPRSSDRGHVFESRHRPHDPRVVAQPGTGEIRRSPSGNRLLAARSVSRRVRLRVSRATRVHRALARRARRHRTRLAPAALHVAGARARDRTPVHRERVTQLLTWSRRRERARRRRGPGGRRRGRRELPRQSRPSAGLGAGRTCSPDPALPPGRRGFRSSV